LEVLDVAERVTGCKYRANWVRAARCPAFSGASREKLKALLGWEASILLEELFSSLAWKQKHNTAMQMRLPPEFSP